MNRIILRVLLIFISAAAGLYGQSINSTQFPSDTRWKQIETERCILIFPEELEPKAIEIAAGIDALYPPVEASLDTEVTKWPVVLNNSLTISNGYVTGAPKHSQLYLLPSQDGFNGTGDWIDFLWSHELRHIVQNEKMQRGFTEFASWLAGEYGWSGMSHFALPRMFWEGDSVITETLLSESGRGRLPDFERGLRANLINGIRFDYNKSSLGYNGSYIDNVQSWYVTGYYFCTYIRKHYGIEAFNKMIEIAADFSFAPLIINIAALNVTGKSLEVLYEECLDELTWLWQEQLDNTSLSKIQNIRSGSEGKIANYFPLGIIKTSGNIAALKSSASHRNQLIEILPDGNNKILKTINPAGSISFNGTIFSWSEQKKDIRWGNKSWSVIRIFNSETGEYRLITDKTRYFAPAISPDGGKIASCEYTEELDSAIVILDASTGIIQKRFPQPAGAVALQPCWSEDGRSIIYIRQHNSRKALYKTDIRLGTEIRLTDTTAFNISYPAAGGGKVYFISSRSGVNQINTVSLSGGDETQAVSSRFGLSHPLVSGSRIIFSDYTQWGWALSETGISEESRLAKESIENGHVDYFTPLAAEEPYSGFLETKEAAGESGGYEVEDYYPAAGLLNFHSRGLGLTSSGTGVKLYLQADDILNYSSDQIYIGWDPAQGDYLAGISGAWAGFYPILLYGAELSTPSAPLAAVLDSSLYAGAALPLNFSEGNLSNYLILQSVFYLYLNANTAPQTAVNSTLNWQYTELTAKKDIMPRSGININSRWYFSIDSPTYNFASAETVFFFPGFLENHGLSIGIEAEYNLSSALRNFSPETLPRGINSAGMSFPLLFNASLNYSLPVAYPDLALGSFLYIPRFYLNIFYDTAAGIFNPEQLFTDPDMEMMNTAGLEFYADFHLLNNIVPLKAGLRLIYDLQSGIFRVEDTTLLLGISLP